MNIDNNFYVLGCMLDLHKKLGDNLQDDKFEPPYRRAYVAILTNNWVNAVAAVRSFEEYKKMWEEEKGSNEDYQNKMFSAVISAYAFMRICLDECKLLTKNAMQSSVSKDAFDVLAAYRRKHTENARRIINIRIKLIHPDDEKEMHLGDVGWGSGDEKITFYLTDIECGKMYKTKLELYPTKDLEWLRQYAEGLAPLLSNCLGLAPAQLKGGNIGNDLS